MYICIGEQEVEDEWEQKQREKQQEEDARIGDNSGINHGGGIHRFIPSVVLLVIN